MIALLYILHFSFVLSFLAEASLGFVIVVGGASSVAPSAPNNFRNGASFSVSSSLSEESPSSQLDEKEHQASNNVEKAIVIGGGPVGLASALTLAKEGYQVSVFEATPAKELKTFNPAVAYLYNINARGQTFTKLFPNVHEKLIERSIPSSDTGFMVAPSDVNQNITYPVMPSVGGDIVSYWIPRHEMTLLLWEAVDEHNADHGQNEGIITFEQGMKCIEVSKNKTLNDNEVLVVVQDVASEQIKALTAKLVVGADGINSQVRNCLNQQSDKLEFDYNPKKFKVKKYISPASGLKIKALQITTDKFTIKDADGEMKPTKAQDLIAMRSTTNGPLDRLSIASLPSKSTINIRPGNCITRPNHKLLTLKTGKEVKDWFQQIFQRVEWDEIVNDEEWERFAKSDGLAFPPCQYSPGLQASNTDGDSGIVLLGDAAHSFSPDIGQGINAGLMDVIQFGECLRKGKEKKEKLSVLLKAYEKIRAPETRALIRIARFGSPYQYNQPLRKDRVGKTLWTMNFALRLLLNKISFGIFPKQMIMLLQDYSLTYRQVARKADLGTLVLKAIVLCFGYFMFLKKGAFSGLFL